MILFVLLLVGFSIVSSINATDCTNGCSNYFTDCIYKDKNLICTNKHDLLYDFKNKHSFMVDVDEKISMCKYHVCAVNKNKLHCNGVVMEFEFLTFLEKHLVSPVLPIKVNDNTVFHYGIWNEPFVVFYQPTYVNGYNMKFNNYIQGYTYTFDEPIHSLQCSDLSTTVFFANHTVELGNLGDDRVYTLSEIGSFLISFQCATIFSLLTTFFLHINEISMVSTFVVLLVNFFINNIGFIGLAQMVVKRWNFQIGIMTGHFAGLLLFIGTKRLAQFIIFKRYSFKTTPEANGESGENVENESTEIVLGGSNEKLGVIPEEHEDFQDCESQGEPDIETEEKSKLTRK